MSRSARWLALGATLLVLLAAAVPATADPSDVYSDFVNTGTLQCDHPKSDLDAVLNDAVLDQYGNPLVLAKLKRLIRKDIARGCYAASSSASTSTSAGSGGGGGDSLIGAPEILAGLAIVGVVIVGYVGRRRLPGRR